MEAKDFVLLMMIPIILISLIIYTDTGPAITGAVANEPAKESNIIGTYSINPSFKAKEKYDLNDYNKIKESLDFIMSCAKQSSVEQCIAQINNNEFEWQLGCDKGAEKVLYDFAEFFQNCIDSQDNTCLCVKDLSLASDKIKEYSLANKKFELIFEETKSFKKIRIDADIGISQDINTNDLSIWSPARYLFHYDSYNTPNVNLFFKDASGDYEGPGLLSKLILYKDQSNFMIFVKQENDNLKNPKDHTVIDSNNNPVEVSKLPNCNIKPKNIYKFCVTKKDYKIMAYDKLDGQVKERSPVVKFAAYIAPAQNP